MQCQFDIAWIGRCKKEVDTNNDFCIEHQKKCCMCDKQATHSCEETFQFVCGFPLCDECNHHSNK